MSPTIALHTVTPVGWLGIGGALLAAVLIALALRAFRARQREAAAGLLEIDRMDSKAFARRMVRLFAARGYRLLQTPYEGEFGADLIAERDHVKYAIQFKRCDDRGGAEFVQQVLAARVHYRCDRAIVVTNTTFTDRAKTFAKSSQVELWDRARLIDELLTAQGSLVTSDTTPQTCVVCGTEVPPQLRDYCLEHDEVFQGQVYCYQHQQLARKQAQEKIAA